MDVSWQRPVITILTNLVAKAKQKKLYTHIDLEPCLLHFWLEDSTLKRVFDHIFSNCIPQLKILKKIHIQHGCVIKKKHERQMYGHLFDFKQFFYLYFLILVRINCTLKHLKWHYRVERSSFEYCTYNFCLQFFTTFHFCSYWKIIYLNLANLILMCITV